MSILRSECMWYGHVPVKSRIHKDNTEVPKSEKRE